MRKKLLLVLLILILALVIIYVTGCSSNYSMLRANYQNKELPAHYGEHGFRNPHTDEIDKNALDFFKMRLFGDDQWADQEQEVGLIPQQPLAADHFQTIPSQPRLTWLGHASFIIELNGKRIVTDPILTDRASPVSFSGPKRLSEPPLTPEQLPQIDVVIISHNHYDHLDEATIKALAKQPRQPKFLVPLGLSDWLLEQGVAAANIESADWWQQIKIDSLTFTATPSQHWSARSLFDRMQSLWASWYIEDSASKKRVWFAGDTGYNNIQFNQIRERLGAVDLALVPVGAYQPEWFMQPQHTSPADAMKLHQDLQAKQSVVMHFATYQLAAEGLQETLDDIAAARAKQQVSGDIFRVIPIGSSTSF
ncbi:L-ascorbate metabolism protein UlaG, beta-lactamase superfamily [Pseudidiomarina planktonica]|uniref:L-ascorbate metabolism protein UlaG, beta-lactamase superfamily n=1 Tax=Pseudidiomarina planktonica TaxID=1323738 RepID=A0A1Y6EPF5_9GAMM|nr:MBL fold metallo-hydrolase [Pseudidiomarina planktonica]RUO65779.1 MBL fold metallo-hydrolase [Pseudidiomarina planktonica]SMQ62850.1 L-ascorbate metabolism protein UlaG, beta-lactamase superfamily [Pseudidiomarina planktonica]